MKGLLLLFLATSAWAGSMRCTNRTPSPAPSFGLTCTAARVPLGPCHAFTKFAEAAYGGGPSHEAPEPYYFPGENNCIHRCPPWPERIAECSATLTLHVTSRTLRLTSVDCDGACEYYPE